MILCIETSTAVCSVALVDKGDVIAMREGLDGQNHAEKITVFIDEMMKEARISYKELDAVAVSMGPGSYTGLRIGVSTAKGFCYAMEKPLLAVDTLAAMANGFISQQMTDNGQQTPSNIFCPMIDARRMEVYSAFFNEKLERISETEALIIDENSFSDLKENHHLYLFGDGADKLASLFKDDEKITVVEKFHCSATYMATMAEESLVKKDFVDVAYFEPFYLKNFVPGIPKVKGLE